MSKRIQVLVAIFAAVLFCGIALADAPVVNIDKKKHEYLAKAQTLILEADRTIVEAQKSNKYDMKGHAAKARDLLIQANQELKEAAEAADAANANRAEEKKEDKTKKKK